MGKGDRNLGEVVAALIADAVRVVLAAWDWYSHWRFHWHAAVAAVLLGLVIAFGPTVIRALRRGHRYNQGWISRVVHAKRKSLSPVAFSTLLRIWSRSLAVPKAQTIVMATVFVLLSYPLQYLLSFAPLSWLFVWRDSSVESLLGT